MSGFDTIIERWGTGSHKWDIQSSKDIIPLWVADMDFRTAPVIIETLHKRVEHGVFGYTYVGEEYYNHIISWFTRRHGYKFTREEIIYTIGVVPAISAIVKALTIPGEGVIIQSPVYNCFYSSIRNNGCRVEDAPLKRVDIDNTTFTYEMDFEALERKASLPDTRLMILCNPHNPAGRVWTREELMRVAEICKRNGVRVVSDEIHCELTMSGYKYTPYGTVDPAAISCQSPSKAFNIAGLQNAFIVALDAEDRKKIDRAINDNEVCDVNPFGVVAVTAAYTPEGEEWLSELCRYIEHNYQWLKEYMAHELPQCPVTRLEATYLPWMDVTALGIPSDELEERLLTEAKVHINAGDMYGGHGFIRFNVACPLSQLREGARRVVEWVKGNLVTDVDKR